MTPFVSVVVPNYNHARFLRKRLDSVFAQTFRDFEVIILDDASTDNSRDVIAEYADRPGVRCIFNEVNGGTPFAQWNRGVGEARGEYVWIAESDDYAEPEFLERLVAALDAHVNVGVAYCQSWLVDDAGAVIGSAREWTKNLNGTRWDSDYINNGRDEVGRYLSRGNTMPNASAIVFRRSVFKQCGGADHSHRLAGDWRTWVKMLMIADVAYVAESLSYFRTHTASVRSTIDSANERREVLEVVLDIAGHARQIEAESRGATSILAASLVKVWGRYAFTVDESARQESENRIRALLTHQGIRAPDETWAEVLADLAFAGYQESDYGKVRKYLPRAVRLNRRMLANRGVWSIGVKAFLGVGRT